MTDMNQSFIRAFAKKDAVQHSQKAKSMATAEAKPARRGAAASSPAETIPVGRPTAKGMRTPAEAAGVKTAAPRSIASLLSSESVMVFSAFDEETIEPRVAEASGSWTQDAAEAAQSAASLVPRDVAAKSAIPAPPKPASSAQLGAKKAIQRVDPTHPSHAKLPSIVPAWEVDQLVWPRTCDQLLASEKPYFEEAARRLLEASRQGMRTLAVCESRRGEGCSTVALCIAKSAAAAGLRVGILDADFQSDGLTEMLGLEVDCNWTQVASDSAAILENSVQILDQSITLFPLSRDVRNSPVAGASPLSFIPRIAEQYDLLVIDFGMLNEGAFAQALASKLEIDAALVVRDLRHSSSRSVQTTVGQIRAAGIEAVGIAENFGAR